MLKHAVSTAGKNGRFQRFQDPHAKDVRIAESDSGWKAPSGYFDSRSRYIAYIASDPVAIAETRI